MRMTPLTGSDLLARPAYGASVRGQRTGPECRGQRMGPTIHNSGPGQHGKANADTDLQPPCAGGGRDLCFAQGDDEYPANAHSHSSGRNGGYNP